MFYWLEATVYLEVTSPTTGPVCLRPVRIGLTSPSSPMFIIRLYVNLESIFNTNDATEGESVDEVSRSDHGGGVAGLCWVRHHPGKILQTHLD